MSAPGGGVMSSSSASSGGGLALPAISSARVPLYASAVVGYRPVLSPACSWLTDSEVIFCGGPRSLIRLDLESRTQAVLSLGADVASISAFALAPSRRAIAVAEVSADGTPSVCVIEWPMTADETARSANLGMPLWAVAPGLPTPRRRRRVIADLAVGGVPVTALAFTPDSRFLLIGGGVTADGVSLTCVEWAKGPNGRVSCAVPNLFASASPNPPPPARISQLDVHPRDSMLIAVSAPGLFRLFRLTEGNAKVRLSANVFAFTLSARLLSFKPYSSASAPPRPPSFPPPCPYPTFSLASKTRFASNPSFSDVRPSISQRTRGCLITA